MIGKALACAVIGLLLCDAASWAKSTQDPVVMTVGGMDVKLSEFEYLYKKNSEQQSAKTSLDDYVKMFVDYKLRVAAALDARLDTTANFMNDYNKYRMELARPYMRNKAVDDSLLHVAYDHACENVHVCHIMMSRGKSAAESARNKALMDSVRRLVAGGADFGELARKYSTDPAVTANGGDYGYISAGMLPYDFEDVAYNTPVGECSEVFETMFGFHMVKVLGRRPDAGQVKTRHILKMTRGLDSLQCAVKRQQIDSISRVLKTGADFADVARRETDEPSGKKSGGDLPWFGSGRMVPAFEHAAFALSENEISEPVETPFGYHIIMCEGRKPVGSFDEMRPQLEEAMARDSRNGIAVKRELERYRNECGVKVDAKSSEKAAAVLERCGGWNAASRVQLGAMEAVVFAVGGKIYTVADIAKLMPDGDIQGAGDAVARFNANVERTMNDAVRGQMIATLPERHAEYRNLLNEYRDGMLLYEVSNSNVWDKANTDHAGLQAYFEAHRGDFNWDKPHYKGYVVCGVSDSIADAAVAYLQSVAVAAEELTTTLRKRFGTNAKIERVIVGKGDNAVVDYVAFDGVRPDAMGRWTAYRPYQGKVIDQPEDAMDVKGVVSMGYQQELENRWMDELRAKYAVKINYKALDSLR